jgi:poly(glycerol-phosphate) alpha-glucosyltransferase
MERAPQAGHRAGIGIARPVTGEAQPDASALRVGILVGSISRRAGGLFQSVRLGAQALADAGVDVRVHGIGDAHAEEDLAAWRPLTPRIHRPIGRPALALAPTVPAALAAGDFDVLHLHGLWSLLSAYSRQWTRRTGRPLMISPRGMLDRWALSNSRMKKRVFSLLFEDANLRAAACIHALNQSEADSIRAYGLTNPIAIIPNAATLPEPGERPAPAWMAADRRVLLFLGRIHPKKGLSETIKAWALLHARAPDVAGRWQLALAGWDDGDHVDALKRDVAALRLPEQAIIFPGALHGEDKAAALANADVFVLASHSEGLPMSVLEAWSYDLPVFMTPACNLPEGFAAGAAIEIGTDPDALAETLATRLDEAAESDMGARGRALVERSFSWPATAAAHVEVYRWLVEGGTPPACVALA